MEYVTFPIVALGAALICLIGVTIYAISQRAGLRNRDEQLAVARAQAYAMLELSQAGVLFLDREHKLMGEASAAAPELLGHTCGAGTAFVQVIAELVDVKVRRETVAFLESMWKAEPSTTVDATQNPLARVHSGSRHLGIRFSRMVLDGRVHHIIVSIERIAAPRIVPHTIEVPALNEDTFAKRLAGETGTRPALVVDAPVASTGPETVSIAPPALPAPAPAPVVIPPMPASVRELPMAALDITDDSLPMISASSPLPPVSLAPAAAPVALAPAAAKSATNENFILSLPPLEPLPALGPLPQATLAPMPVGSPEISPDLATTITSPETAREAVRQGPIEPDPSSIIDPPDPRLSEVLKEIMHVETSRLDNFLGEARDKAGQLRAILKLPARDPQAFREKLVLILELIRGIHARAKRMPLQSVCDRAERFEARGETRRPAEPPGHPGRGPDPPARLAHAEWPLRFAVHRHHAAFGHHDGHDDPPAQAQEAG
jgi:hypothetical protein